MAYWTMIRKENKGFGHRLVARKVTKQEAEKYDLKTYKSRKSAIKGGW